MLHGLLGMPGENICNNGIRKYQYLGYNYLGFNSHASFSFSVLLTLTVQALRTARLCGSKELRLVDDIW